MDESGLASDSTVTCLPYIYTHEISLPQRGFPTFPSLSAHNLSRFVSTFWMHMGLVYLLVVTSRQVRIWSVNLQRNVKFWVKIR